MNKINFDAIVRANRDAFKFVTLPPETMGEDGVERSSSPSRQRGCIGDMPAYDFDTQYYQFSFVSLLTKKEAIDALCKVKHECNKVAAMSLFQIPNKHLKMEEFEQAQTQQISQVSETM